MCRFRRSLSWRALALLISVFACKRQAPAELEDAGAEDEVRPVYAKFGGDALPEAAKLCAALHDVAPRRRAQCCGGTQGTSASAECTRVLSAALRSGAVKLDAQAVARCVAAEERSHAGCSWIGQWTVPVSAGCRGVIVGHLKQGALCRSSLECEEELRCLGAGPTDEGRCGPPRAAGQACLTAVDSLAGYLREDEEAHHPECAGFCGHRRCMDNAPPGGACKLARECPRGQHCDGAACVAGAFAAEGEKCVADACASGLRCVNGACRKPKEDGAACASDYECRGGCIPATHVCGMRCDAF